MTVNLLIIGLETTPETAVQRTLWESVCPARGGQPRMELSGPRASPPSDPGIEGSAISSGAAVNGFA